MSVSARRLVQLGLLSAVAAAASGCAVYARPAPGVSVAVEPPIIAPAPVVVAPAPAVVYGGGWGYHGGYYGPRYYGGGRPYYAPPVVRGNAWGARPIVPPRGRW